jgi:hypothetical protein
MYILAGVIILVSGCALLWAFMPAPGRSAARREWIEISVAIMVTTALGLGLMLVVSEIGGLLLGQ